MLVRSFCKTEWTKPKFVNKPYCERRRAPELPLFVQTTRGHGKVRYDEFWKMWDDLQCQQFKTSPLQGNMPTIFASLGLCDHKNGGRIEDKNVACDVSKKEDESKKRQVDAILRTYSELNSLTKPQPKKWRHTVAGEKGTGESIINAQALEGTSTLNATTANSEEGEKLAQKIENIEEVPLVEAEPDIIKPPKTTGPAVMNMTQNNATDDNAMPSDVQGNDKHRCPEELIDQRVEDKSETLHDADSIPARTKNFFESELEGFYQQKLSNFPLNTTLPEVTADDVSLTEVLRRVRERNRLLRCRDICYQLCSSNVAMEEEKHRFLQPGNVPAPQWSAWPPSPQYPRNKPNFPMQPSEPRSMPRKSEPITPDSRPPGHTNRSSKVNPVNLALHLGPLVSCFKHACALLPLLAYAHSTGKNPGENSSAELTDMVVQELRNFANILTSIYKNCSEKEEGDIAVDVSWSQTSD